MRRFYFLLLLFLTANSSLFATHIVGGEFELVHIEDFNYRLNLVLYFDEVNGNPLILENERDVTVTIFRKSDDAPISNLVLTLVRNTDVSYTNPKCAVGSLSTLRLLFTERLTLSSEVFNDPEGYYIVWERCCRNYTIDNIFSQDPNSGGVFAGQTFYLEFPAVVDESGEPFINSSPILFAPLSDYACMDRLYFADFSGEDPDGDSIVYSKADPLNTSAGQALPLPSPRPHLGVQYRPGFNLANIIPGDPAFNIDKDGFITVRPAMPGLFVFAIKAEEYRNGKKIGEVRRDFQMLVLDCPDPGVKPELKVETPDGSISDVELSVEFGIDSERCVSFVVTDQDEDESQTLELDWVAINFEDNANTIESVRYDRQNRDSVLVEVCFKECPPLQDVPFILDFIASDDACPLPLKDTLRLNVLVRAPENNAPEITLDDRFPDGVVDIIVGELVDLGINGFDVDGDSITVDLLDADQLRSLYGLDFVAQKGLGEVKAQFGWQTNCSDLPSDFSPVELDLAFIVKDDAKCFATQDTVFLKVNLRDIEPVIDAFEPANVFTPNGDIFNNTFRMPTLPEDNCESEFQGIQIFNRWGRIVFKSEDRNFTWDGKGASSGIYFYNLVYADTEYKGTVSLVR